MSKSLCDIELVSMLCYAIWGSATIYHPHHHHHHLYSLLEYITGIFPVVSCFFVFFFFLSVFFTFLSSLNFYRTCICCRPSVCLSSVTLVRPTQTVQIFGNISTALCTLASIGIHWKFHGDRPRGTNLPWELNTRGVVKYSDFGPIEGYISETVQDMR